MKTDKLASFRVDSELWKQFQAIARDNDTTASALLVGYIESVVNTGNVNTSTPQSIQPSIDNSPNQSIQDIDKRIDTKITESLEDGEIGEAIAKMQQKFSDENNELQRQVYALEASLEELKRELLSKIDAISENCSKQSPDTSPQSPDTRPKSPDTNHQSPVTSPQSTVPNHQSPDTSPQSPDTSQQSPVTSHQSPITEPAQIERSLVENIRTTLKRKGFSATTEQIRAAFFAAGWDGANYQEIRKDILEILSGAMP